MIIKQMTLFLLLLTSASFSDKLFSADFDLLIKNATIYNGAGNNPFAGSVAINKDRIVVVGKVTGTADKIIDAKGMALAPGFINMLSWATESLLEDGRSMGGIMQGVTLEVMGEGWSMGPVNDQVKQDLLIQQNNIRYEINWTTLADYLHHLERKGISTNVASFVGATTLRIHEVGHDNRPATAEELKRMQRLVDQAMREGALGVGSSLIYAPANYAPTEELIALNKIVAKYDGMYISHMRSEGNNILPAIDELIRISREAGVPAEIYHLKMGGQPNWNKLPKVIEKIENARAQGLQITADMYLYTAGATGLDAAMPPWVQEGGEAAWIERLKDPATRAQVKKEMNQNAQDWENLFYFAKAEGMILLDFKQPKLKPLIGKTLAEVAKSRGTDPADTIIDLLLENNADVGTAYYLMSEENVKKQIQLPWMSFGSDGASMAPEGVFLQSSTHPRSYGNVSRLLGKYVREEKVISLQEAIRKLTWQPAKNLKIKKRGKLAPGYFADIVIFDPDKVQDHATFDNPHQLSTGMIHVFVNGEQVVKEGKHTGATPGRVVYGPGKE